MDDTLEAVRLSYSKLDTLSRCPQRFYRRYILGEPDIVSGAQIVGRAFHEALQANFEHRIQTGRDLDHLEVAKAYRQSFDREAAKPTFRDLENLTEDQIDWGKDMPKELKEQGQRALLRYHRDHVPFLHPKEIEQKYTREAGTGVTVVGILDLLTLHGVVVDFKVVNRPWDAGLVETALQPTVYAYLLDRPISFEFHFITRSKASIGISVRRTTRTSQDIAWFRDVHLPQAVALIRNAIYLRSPGMQCVNCAQRLGCGYRVS